MPGSVVRQTARRYTTPPLKFWRSSSLHKIFGRSGTAPPPERFGAPEACAAACLARVAAKFPLCPRRAAPCKPPPARPPVRRAHAFAVGMMAVTPSVAALLTPASRCCRLPADLLAGVRRVLLARARPSASVRDRLACCIRRTADCCSPHSAVTPPRRTAGRMFVPLSIGQQPPSTCTTRPRRKAGRVHVVHRPTAQGKGSRRSLLGLLAPRAALWPSSTSGHKAQGPAAAAVTRALACLCRSSAGKPPVPRSHPGPRPGAGRRNAPHWIEEALSVDLWPGAPFRQFP